MLINLLNFNYDLLLQSFLSIAGTFPHSLKYLFQKPLENIYFCKMVLFCRFSLQPPIRSLFLPLTYT